VSSFGLPLVASILGHAGVVALLILFAAQVPPVPLPEPIRKSGIEVMLTLPDASPQPCANTRAGRGTPAKPAQQTDPGMRCRSRFSGSGGQVMRAGTGSVTTARRSCTIAAREAGFTRNRSGDVLIGPFPEKRRTP
jgi:hypothetical protein